MGLTGVEQNNPSGDAAESDNNQVVFFDALMALPALSNSFEDNDNDDASSTALGLLANGSDAAASTTVGLLADGIDAPPASAEDADAKGAGLSNVDGNPVGSSATGNNGALGPPANGSAAPPALAAAPATSTGSAAPLASTTALGSLANANGLLGGHNAMDEGAGGNVGINVDDGATGDCLLGLMATGGVDPLASPTAHAAEAMQRHANPWNINMIFIDLMFHNVGSMA